MAERRIKNSFNATRIFWLPVNFKEYEINIGVQVTNDTDLSNLDKLELSNVIDNIDDNVLQSNLLDLIVVSNLLYDYVASYYTTHDIRIDIMNFNQPVFTTIYLFKQ
jgi:hypothetical protein